MKRLKLKSWPGAAYRSAVVGRWPVGDEREVDDDIADYLLETFGDHFAEVKPKKKPKKPKKPKAD